MAFGRLTTKWRIFRRLLENGTARNGLICRASAVLYNYVLNETNPDKNDEDFIVRDIRAGEDSNLGYTPTVEEEQTVVTPEGSSLRRTAFVRIINRDGMARPLYNIQRNNANV